MLPRAAEPALAGRPPRPAFSLTDASPYPPLRPTASVSGRRLNRHPFCGALVTPASRLAASSSSPPVLAMRYAVLALSLSIAACDSGPVPVAEAQGVRISPDRDGDLVFNGSATVQTAFVNGPSQTVYVYDTPGLPFTLERLEGDGWVRLELPYVTAAVVPTPLALRPSEFRPLRDLRISDLDDAGPGAYRIVAYAFDDERLDHLLPEPQRVSPTFRIVR